METVEDILKHYGVVGMRWGVRRSNSPGWVSKTTVNSSKKRRTAAAGVRLTRHVLKTPPKTKVSLGKPGPKHSEDAKKAAAAKSKVHRRTNTKALSNDELQALVKRMNLEQQFVRLQGDSKKKKITKKGGSLAAEILGGAAKQTAKNTASTHMSKVLEDLLKKR